jgi:hypothetical protein
VSSSGALILLVALVVVAGLAAAVYAAVQRTRGMKAFAAAHGLRYSGSDWQLGDCGFDLFTRGNRRQWSHVLSGAWQGVPNVYADYQYTVQEGRNSETFSFSVVVVTIPLATPQVEVAPRGFLGRLVEEVGSGSGLQFESQDFNHRFAVHCADPRFAYELIDARMMETLLGLDPGLHLTFGATMAMVWCKRLPLRSLERLFDAAAAIIHRVPDLVRREYGGIPPPPAAVG